MAAGAHRGDHDIAFYEATIGETLEATTVGAATPIFLNEDSDGPLRPARYLIQVASVSVAGVFVWVGLSPFKQGAVAAFVAGPGRNRIPLSQSVLIAIETNVLEAEDDRITVETIGGTATIYVTRISTLIPKGKVS